MRAITHIVVHCTATPQNTSVASIQRYWRENLGWKSPGYHIIIPAYGKPFRLAPDTAITNGVRGHNSTSLHVAYIGGVDANNRPLDNRTEAQKQALIDVLCNWKGQHNDAIIQGHRDFPGVAKACPSFDARTEYADLK